MILISEMAFSGGGLIRQSHLRGADLEASASRGRILPFWQGRPLLDAAKNLVYLPIDSPVLAQGKDLIFLGQDPGMAAETGAIFACDVSDWTPPTLTTADLPGFLDPAVQGHPDLPAGWGFADLRQALLTLSPLDSEVAATAKSLIHWHQTHRFCSACGAESGIALAGWQRNCPACSAQHYPRTDPVVIMLITRGDRLLLGRSPAWPAGMFSCLAGFMEPGETIAAAVRREVHEETGVRVGRVTVLADQPWPFPSSLMLGCQGEAESEAITIDPAEIEEALWLDRARMAQVLAGVDERITAPRKGSIARALIESWIAENAD